MKKILLLILSVLPVVAAAQSQTEKYAKRYELLVSKFGPAGIGIETLLDSWAAVDSTDVDMLVGKFRYYFVKSQSKRVVPKYEKRYLGMEPVLTLKDSAGRDVSYYEEYFYDDELYGESMRSIDKAIRWNSNRLDLRLLKADAYVAYEKGSPDMALNYLETLSLEASRRSKDWMYDDRKVGKEFFADSMQEYCYEFYTIGTDNSREAFFKLSETLAELFPEKLDFISNIGTYHLLKKDFKLALKWYSKVLKKSPENYIAIKNSLIAARQSGNAKAVKKYQQMLDKYNQENSL